MADNPNLPGWHPDQTNPGWLRYWDGQRWTGRARDRNHPWPESKVEPSSKQPGSSRAGWILAALLISGLLFIIVSLS